MPTMKGNPAMDRWTGFPGYSEKIPHQCSWLNSWHSCTLPTDPRESQLGSTPYRDMYISIDCWSLPTSPNKRSSTLHILDIWVNLTIQRSKPHSIHRNTFSYRAYIKISALSCEAVVKILVQFANVLELNLKEIQRKRPRVFSCRLVGSFHTHPFSSQLRQLTLPSSLFSSLCRKRTCSPLFASSRYLGKPKSHVITKAWYTSL